MIATRNNSAQNRFQTTQVSNLKAKQSDHQVDEIFLHEMPLDRFLIASTFAIAFLAITYVLGWQIGLTIGAAMTIRGLVRRAQRDRSGNIPVVWNGTV